MPAAGATGVGTPPLATRLEDQDGAAATEPKRHLVRDHHHGHAIRSERFPIWKIGYGSNMAVIGAIALTVALQIALLYVPFLRDFFGTVALPPIGFLICVILAVVTYFGVEADKWVYRRHSK